MTKHKLKQNYQHTNKAQCPNNNDRWDVDKQFVVVIMIVGAWCWIKYMKFEWLDEIGWGWMLYRVLLGWGWGTNKLLFAFSKRKIFWIFLFSEKYLRTGKKLKINHLQVWKQITFNSKLKKQIIHKFCLI